MSKLRFLGGTQHPKIAAKGIPKARASFCNSILSVISTRRTSNGRILFSSHSKRILLWTFVPTMAMCHAWASSVAGQSQRRQNCFQLEVSACSCGNRNTSLCLPYASLEVLVMACLSAVGSNQIASVPLDKYCPAVGETALDLDTSLVSMANITPIDPRYPLCMCPCVS